MAVGLYHLSNRALESSPKLISRLDRRLRHQTSAASVLSPSARRTRKTIFTTGGTEVHREKKGGRQLKENESKNRLAAPASNLLLRRAIVSLWFCILLPALQKPNQPQRHNDTTPDKTSFFKSVSSVRFVDSTSASGSVFICVDPRPSVVHLRFLRSVFLRALRGSVTLYSLPEFLQSFAPRC